MLVAFGIFGCLVSDYMWQSGAIQILKVATSTLQGNHKSGC